MDPFRYIKAIPVEGALAALAKGEPSMAVGKASCAAERHTQHAASTTVTDQPETLQGEVGPSKGFPFRS